MRVLVIEDDRKVASFIQTGLEQEGYAVDVLHDGNNAGEQASAIDYDVVVLDLMLPGRSGFQVLRDIRARKATAPVLILTARDAVEERIAGLDAGADDYMAKPFALAELSARLRALLRRGTDSPVLQFADLSLDAVSRTAVRGGRAIELTAREAALLELLLHHPGRVVSRPVALASVWSDGAASTENVVDRYVAYLRRKLGDPPLIHTVRGAGFVLRR